MRSSFISVGRSVAGVVLILTAFTSFTHAVPREEASVADLKARIASSSPTERTRLCIQIAQKQVDQAGKLYAASDMENAQAAMTDAVAYSELARDYSIQTHKYEKQAEIAIREMTRKLNTVLHTLTREDQTPVKEAVTRLESVRDDLLSAMFKKVRHE